MIALAIFAYLIDKFFGEFPVKHPVMWMGDFIKAFEQRYYRDDVLTGALLVFCLLAVTLLLSLTLIFLCAFLPSAITLVVLACLASMGLAMHMLHDCVAGVLTAADPKQAVSYLVSRDTAAMDETAVYKAALETWAENLSDGVIAPLCYLLLFGLPGIAVYKAINTLDSMVGYKTPHYFNFGKVAARLDDVANYLPARLTALLIVMLAKDPALAWRCMVQDSNKLESPNAGYPIAAMAGALGIALGGDAYYHGQLKAKPTLGLALNPITPTTLQQALAMRAAIDRVVLGSLTVAAIAQQLMQHPWP